MKFPTAPRMPGKLRSSLSALPLVLVGLLSVLLFGGLVGLGAGLFALILIAPVLVFGVLLFTGSFSSFRFGGEGVFWLMLGLTLLTALADTVSPVRTRGVMSIVLIPLAIYALRGLFIFAGNSWLGKLMVAVFALFFALGAASSISAGRIHWHPFFYQIGYDLKLPIMLLLGFSVTLGERSEQRFWLLVKVVLVLCLAALAVEFAAPSVHHLIARNAGGGQNGNPLVPGLHLATGPFVHPSVLASVGSLFLCCVFVRRLGGQGSTIGNYLLLCGFMLVLLLAGERQEIFDALAACAILLFAAKMKPRISAVLLAVAAVALLLGALLLMLGPVHRAELGLQWGILPSYQALGNPRTVLYLDGFHLANTYFPFGTGFGKFGGDAARMYDRSVYEMLGYSTRYWWYRQDLYLLDTYWPNLFAETGWIGGSVVFLFGGVMTLFALQRAWTVQHPRERMLWRLAFVGHFLAFTGSLTAPIYGDPNAVAVPFMFFGMAFAYSLQLRRAEAAERAKRGGEFSAHAARPAAVPATPWAA
ncbi:hypothetical protein ASC94_23580 [Massilia sp. Root418]|uniref:hypothetical protein n=1 Tax=Massilia sp. Root418 TaxID=1736532 RepID=UPI0006F8F8F5|nr:hypothetical protein [Massilia sp. Root418]KQW88413.1 hypothetical protein ASC94_23580 [Massilia sp. Root418]